MKAKYPGSENCVTSTQTVWRDASPTIKSKTGTIFINEILGVMKQIPDDMRRHSDIQIQATETDGSCCRRFSPERATNPAHNRTGTADNVVGIQTAD